MRFEDISDYWKLCKFTTNPFEIIKFRWNGSKTKGTALKINFKTGADLYIRGGYDDFHMFHRIFLRDEYRVKDLLQKKLECVVDLGGNVGLFSALVAPITRSVYTYEPCPPNLQQLEKNIAKHPNVTVVPEAVSGGESIIKLYLPKNEGKSGVYSSFNLCNLVTEDNFYEVPATSLDALFQRHQIDWCDLVKIDIEGQEYAVFQKTSDQTYAKIGRICGEYHNPQPDDPSTRIEFLTSFLEDRGFTVTINPHARKINHGMFFAEKT